MASKLFPQGDQNDMQAFVQWTDDAGGANEFHFDNVLSEEWKPTATVTEHPVEQGANVGDHIRVELVTCDLQIHCTNEPLGANQFASPTTQALSIPIGPSRLTSPQALTVPFQVWDNEVAVNATVTAISDFVAEAIGSNIEWATATRTGDELGRVVAKALRGVRDADAFTASLGLAINALALDTLFGFPARTIQDLVVVGLEAAFEALALRPAVALPLVASVQSSVQPRPKQTVDAQVQQFANSFEFVGQTIAKMEELMNAGTLFTVVGSKRVGTNMVLTGAPHKRDSDEGSGAILTLSFKELRIVATQVVSAPIPALPRAVGPVDKGAQNPSDAPANVQGSVLLAIANNPAVRDAVTGSLATFGLIPPQ